MSSHRETLVDIVLPCLNEADALPWVLQRVPPSARAIVVDNGSTDDSVSVALQHGATVVECTQRGYGAACHAGLLAATAEVVAFCDCDATLDPADAVLLVTELTARPTLVIGRRRPVDRGAWSLRNRLANRELARRIRKRTGVRIDDVGALRVARRQDLLDLRQTDRRSGYPVETVVRAADAGWNVVQVDVAYRSRKGRSKVTGTWRGTAQAVRDMSQALHR
ncbi:glycosyltransferase family 2 protein [Jatrophihabitans sp. YIM 134969]